MRGRESRLKRKPGALHQSTALLQSDTRIKKLFETYYSSDARTFLEVLGIIYEKGVDDVATALLKLESISPMDMSADKVKVICDKISENKNSIMKTGTDRLSQKSKSTLGQYDKLRQLQSKEERMVV